MLEVRGFRGVRFAADRITDLDDVITPPYDVITPEERRALVERSPYSMARLILPEERDGLDPYAAAARDLRSWLEEGVLRQDERESIYLLEQVFTEPDGSLRTRRGFLAVCKLPEWGERTVLGHERTFNHVVDDRYRLTESTRANLGPVFVVYDDGGRRLEFLSRWPTSDVDLEARTIDGVRQRVWRLDCPSGLTDYFREKRLYIADGHHRFLTACMYRDHRRALQRDTVPREYDFVLMGFISLTDPGLSIYATHRLLDVPDGYDESGFLDALRPWFDVIEAPGDLAEAVERYPECAIGLVMHGRGQYVLRLRDIDRRTLLGADRSAAWRDLDVAVLHKGIVERIMGLGDGAHFTYERDARKVVAAVESGRYRLGFVHRAPTAEQIRACAEAGETMPHKSTYFFPKLPSGAVIHLLD